jgi:riboflavin kinase/FMN adenylyltransferase
MFDTGRGVLIEAFLLDFEDDIYGTELRLDFLRRLRGERTFASIEALIEQMARDVEDARAVANASATVPRR